MPDEDIELQPESQEVKPEPKKRAKPKAKAAKPLVEGINAPKSTNDIIFIKPSSLTDSEKKLISETGNYRHGSGLLPDSVLHRTQKKPHRGLGWVIVLIILAALVLGGYRWYKGSQAQPAETSQSQEPSGNQAATNANATSTPAVATSTPAQSTSTPATTTPEPPKELKLKVNSTPNGFLNVRTAPSLSGRIVTKIHPGETYIYTQVQSGWYKITLPNGQSGWVSGEYVTLQ